MDGVYAVEMNAARLTWSFVTKVKYSSVCFEEKLSESDMVKAASVEIEPSSKSR